MKGNGFTLEFVGSLTLIRLGFLKEVFSWGEGVGGKFNHPFTFQEELV